MVCDATMLAAELPNMMAGPAGIVIGVFCLALAVMWFILPFVIMSGFARLERETKRSNELLELLVRWEEAKGRQNGLPPKS